MTPFVINKKSWHFRLYSLYGKDADYDLPTDFCAYCRGLLFVIVITCLFAVIGLAAIYGLVDSLLALGFSIFYGTILVGPVASVSFIFLTIFGATTAAMALMQSWLYSSQYSEPSFLGTAWRSFKDKFCLRVEFK